MTGTQNIDICAVPEVYIDCKSHVEKKVFTWLCSPVKTRVLPVNQ